MKQKILLLIVLATFLGAISFVIFSKLNSNSTQISTSNSLTADENPPVGSRYIAYSESAFNDSKNTKRVLFFHAKWCPTCKAANSEILSRINEIPENVRLFKTDYDSMTALKDKYAITYQHTYVLVDAKGNEIRKWNGGAIDELIQNTM